MNWRIALSLILAILLSPLLMADDLNKPADLSVPESPAFTALGVTPQDVTRPASPNAFAMSLLNAVDDKGKLQSGMAIDTSPYLLFRGKTLDLQKYQANAYIRALAQIKLSAATTKPTSDDPTQRFSAGLHYTIFDHGDPRSDAELLKCFADNTTLPTSPAVVEETVVTFQDSKALKDCREKSEKRNWNAASWTVAIAPIWVTPDGSANELSRDGGAAWTSYAYGFKSFGSKWLSEHGQVIFHARFRDNEHVKDDDGVTRDHDKRVYGIRFRVGAPRFNGSVEGTYTSDQSSLTRVSKRRILVGLERRIIEGLWLQISVGRDLTALGASEQIVARSSVHWSFGQSSSQ